MDQEKPLVHKFEDIPRKNMTKPFLPLFIVIILLGIGTGYIMAKGKNGSGGVITQSNPTSGDSIKKGETYGSTDEKTFKDSAEGVLKEGGIEGEGAFHLVRPGGESQYVYLTSGVVDLSKFIDKKVKIWGQTNSSKKAGWLMEVGRLQVL